MNTPDRLCVPGLEEPLSAVEYAKLEGLDEKGHEHREAYGQKRFPHGAALFALLGGAASATANRIFMGAEGCPTRFDQRAASKIPLHTSIGGQGRTTKEISGFVLIFVLTLPFLKP